MKTRFICLLLVGWALGAMSCADDPASLLADELQGKEAATLDANAASALRSSTMGSVRGGSVFVDSKGQKGRDHRDGNDYTKYLQKYADDSGKEIGKLYPVSHDYASDKCTYQLYLGAIPIDDVVRLYDHATMEICFYGIPCPEEELGTCVIFCPYFGCSDHYKFMHRYNTFDHERVYHRIEYHIGDFFEIPCWICEHATLYIRIWVFPQQGDPFFVDQTLESVHSWYPLNENWQ